MVVDIFNTDKKYNIIYADPPWSYKTYSSKGKGRSAESHYATMSVNDICKLPVNQIADNDCALLMWTTFPNLEYAFQVLNAWGFTYKTVAFVWVKQNKKSDSLFWGMGFWTRANAEMCLIATKGKPKRISASVSQLVFAHITKHSEKPPVIRKKIIELIGDLPRIELFARQQADGWDCWGNEV